MRDQELQISFRAPDDADPARWKYDLLVTEMGGTPVRAWQSDAAPVRDGDGRWTLAAKWPDPRLWDFENPHRYRLFLTVQDAGSKATYTETFGFREFRIAGRDFLLNEKPLRLRPHSTGMAQYYPGVPEIIRGEIEGYKSADFNIKQIWPENFLERGRFDSTAQFASMADELGLGLMAPAASFAPLVETWNGTSSHF